MLDASVAVAPPFHPPIHLDKAQTLEVAWDKSMVRSGTLSHPWGSGNIIWSHSKSLSMPSRANPRQNRNSFHPCPFQPLYQPPLPAGTIHVHLFKNVWTWCQCDITVASQTKTHRNRLICTTKHMVYDLTNLTVTLGWLSLHETNCAIIWKINTTNICGVVYYVVMFIPILCNLLHYV